MKTLLKQFNNHIFIALIVLSSLVVLFLPAFLKKTSDGLHHSVKIKLPAKPEQPIITKVDKDELFKSIKVANIDLNQPQFIIEDARKTIERARPISSKIDSIKEKHFQPHKVKRFTVQLASFKVEKNAKALINQLKKKGFLASCEKKNKNNYRVVVRNLNTEAEAKKLQRDLAKMTHLQGIIIYSQAS